jgi:hypothetical protein
VYLNALHGWASDEELGAVEARRGPWPTFPTPALDQWCAEVAALKRDPVRDGRDEDVLAKAARLEREALWMAWHGEGTEAAELLRKATALVCAAVASA